jgi:hypothetical protein
MECTLEVPAKYMYMGVNLDVSNYMSPLSWLVRAVKKACSVPPDAAGPRDPEAVCRVPKKRMRRIVKSAKSWLGLAHRIVDEWFRQTLAWYHQARGRVVIFDRHYFVDFYAYDVEPGRRQRTWTSRVHGFMLAHLFPKPDLVICLDAPGKTLFDRKGEGTPELLERRRRDYAQMRSVVKRFALVDASQKADAVAAEVARHILRLYQQKKPSGSLRHGEAQVQ